MIFSHRTDAIFQELCRPGVAGDPALKGHIDSVIQLAIAERLEKIAYSLEEIFSTLDSFTKK